MPSSETATVWLKLSLEAYKPQHFRKPLRSDLLPLCCPWPREFGSDGELRPTKAATQKRLSPDLGDSSLSCSGLRGANTRSQASVPMTTCKRDHLTGSGLNLGSRDGRSFIYHHPTLVISRLRTRDERVRGRGPQACGFTGHQPVMAGGTVASPGFAR